MWSWYRLTRRQVIVNLHGGRAFEGVMWGQSGPLIFLRHAVMHSPENPDHPLPMDGEVVVERREIEFIQMIR